MKTPVSVLTFALGMAMLLPASRDAHASYGGMQRCRAADGSAVYTDRPCGFMGATPEALSSELRIRIASEAAREPAAYADASQPQAVQASAASNGRRSLLAGCARTPTQLAMDIQGSIALRDVNRLAESWQWAGVTQAQATPLMKRLERLAQAPVQSIQYFDAQMGLGMQLASNDSDADGRAGILQMTVGGDGLGQSLELNVERYAGCYFVHF